MNKHFMTFLLITLLCMFCFPAHLTAREPVPGEEIYRKVSEASKKPGYAGFIGKVEHEADKLNWDSAVEIQFSGTLRRIQNQKDKTAKSHFLFLIRDLAGKTYLLPLSGRNETDANYKDLEKMMTNKLIFSVKALEITIDGTRYPIAQLIDPPAKMLLDKLFKILIIVLLFTVMIGMGLTLSIKDFVLIFIKPAGIITGQILQFAVMPLIAMFLGKALGFYDNFPYIFAGLILISVIPGGVTSNLVTYYAKGDLALSISMTSFSTVLSLIFSPILLSVYCSNIPDVKIPARLVVLTIAILVIIPLFIGMSVRAKWPEFAEKSKKFFSILGIISLLFLMIAGIFSNLHSFMDTHRYGVLFYSTLAMLCAAGTASGILIPKMVGIFNEQIRAISIEIGIQNSALAMSIALLLQDYIGDFHSGMFITSGIYGLIMYVVVLCFFPVYNKFLPQFDVPVAE